MYEWILMFYFAKRAFANFCYISDVKLRTIFWRKFDQPQKYITYDIIKVDVKFPYYNIL